MIVVPPLVVVDDDDTSVVAVASVVASHFPAAANNEASPTFENTIEAMGRSGKELNNFFSFQCQKIE